jgi:hypothetical protein
MEMPIIKLFQRKKNIFCTIKYKDIFSEFQYDIEKCIFIIKNKTEEQISFDFIKINSLMWDDVCKEFNMNPGSALNAGHIDLSFCNHLRFASTVAFFIGDKIYNKSEFKFEKIKEEYKNLNK